MMDTCVMLLVMMGQSAQGLSPPRWADRRAAGPFVCHADFSLEGRQYLLAELDQLQKDIVHHLGVPPCDEVIHVYLFAEEAVYRRYMNAYFPRIVPRRAMFIKGRGSGMVFAFDSEQLDVDVRHECTHALLHGALPMVPLWLDEGLAEYFEPPAQFRASGHVHLAATRWRARFGRRSPLAHLEQVRDLDQMGEDEYRRAWSWVHFMLHGPPEAREELVGFLADIRDLRPPDLLSRRLHRRLPELDEQFNFHFTRSDQ